MRMVGCDHAGDMATLQSEDASLALETSSMVQRAKFSLATVRPLILGDAKIRKNYEVAKFSTRIRKNRK